MNTQTKFSLLESLPQDLLGDILSRVASSSVEDICQCLTVSKTIASVVEDHRVFMRLNLRRQAMNPLVIFLCYHRFVEKCINSNNPAAQYIKGIKQYFIFDNRRMRLVHLNKSAEGSYDKGIYLYGMLLLCNGNIAEGKTVLSSLGWETDKCRADHAWKEVKKSMRFILVIMKPGYTTTLRNNWSPLSCHRNDMDNRCPSWKKQLVTFQTCMPST